MGSKRLSDGPFGRKSIWLLRATVILGSVGVILAQPLVRTGWTAVADSEVSSTNPASDTLDGSTSSYWHTLWGSVNDPLPHTLTLTMGGATNKVTGLTYLPRQDASNGNIGKYEIYLSADGTTWPRSPVKNGTFLDNSNLKTVTFTGANAKAVRLKALTEAGSRGPWTTAAEVNILGTVVSGPSVDGRLGSWGPVIPFPLVPVAAAVLPNGKVLTWSAYKDTDFGIGYGAYTQTATYDPATGSVSEKTVTNTNHDMFCPGISMLANGMIVVTGGDNAEKTSIYNPSTSSWQPGPNMNIPRGYQASTLTSTGNVFTLGGSWSGGNGGKNGELFSPTGGWRLLSSVVPTPILTADPGGVYRQDNHGWFFGWSNGEVFHAGPSVQMNWFTTAGNGGRRAAGRRPGGDAMCGNAVMYDTGKILTLGGATAYENAPATAAASVITLSGTTVSVRAVSPMAFARGFVNSVVLPDGKVAVFGGMTNVATFSDATAVLNAEIWDPATEKFTTLAKAAVPRTYHGVAVLLPDGTVFTGGGGLCGGCSVNHLNAEIFTPPNLLRPNGQKAPRPTLSVSQSNVNTGSTVKVTAKSVLKSICIIRFGSATHSLNTDQRRLELCGPATKTCIGGANNVYTVTIPADPGIALPGNWMLFGVNNAGVPSRSKTLKIARTVNGLSAASVDEMGTWELTAAEIPAPRPPGQGQD